MRIVILGAGKTGSYVAQSLAEKHDVILIDHNAKTIEQAGRDRDIATLHSESISAALFADLLEKKPDLFFAATGDDATNLVACSFAKNLGFPKTVARVKGREFLHHIRLDFERLFFVDYFIGPENLAAQDLFNAIVHPEDMAIEHFAHGAIQMRTLELPSNWGGGSQDLAHLHFPKELIIGLIRRKTKDEEKVIFPHGEDHLLPCDRITVIGEAKEMHRLKETFPFVQEKVRSVILIGGTLVAAYLAQLLLEQRISVRIIEEDLERCKDLSDWLPHATIIHRNGEDPSLLKAERVQDIDALVSCTESDGTNFLVASLAKYLGCPKAIAMISDSRYVPLLEKADVLPALSARVTVTNRILSILHEENVLSVSSLTCDSAKIVELKVSPSSSIIGIPLSELKEKLPKDLIIAVIESKGRVMIGKGDCILCPDDTVIVICHPNQIPQISKMLH